MGFLQNYSSILLKHPAKILLGSVAIVLSLFMLALSIRPLPSFKDPLLGFEARDTLISSRLNAWHLLSDETSAIYNNLSLSPNSLIYENSYQHPSTFWSNNDEAYNRLQEPPLIEMSTQYDKNTSVLSVYVPDEEDKEYYQSLNSTKHIMPSLMHHSLGSSKAFCGKLYEGYAQVVVAPTVKSSSIGLFNLNSISALCQLDHILRLEHSDSDSYIFQRDCERYQNDEDVLDGSTSCCNSWSLPNYIACLSNKSSCTEITSQDIRNSEQLINLCAPYFLKAPHEECFTNLSKETSSPPSTSSINDRISTITYEQKPRRSYCDQIPEKCLKCDGWTYTLMNYLVNENFIKGKSSNDSRSFRTSKHQINNSSKESSINKLVLTNIFLPIAKSSSLLSYYHALSKYNLKTPYAQVKAMDLGLKNSLFEHLITDDAKLFIIALLSILTLFSIYTWSVLLSLVVLLIICLSLCMSYTIYTLLLDIQVFPFINLLAIVISFGICSDNVMLFCKNWISDIDYTDTSTKSKNQNEEQLKIARILKKAVVSTFIATLATACSFIISAISNVVAIRCFCIFATLSVITNYLLIVVLLPPALVIDSKLSSFVSTRLSTLGPEVASKLNLVNSTRVKLLNIAKVIRTKYILELVNNFRFYLMIAFIAILFCASILVFYQPTLLPSDEDEIQLLSRKHTFEQYDRNLRKQFAFERAKSNDINSPSTNLFYHVPDTLPIRVVFGIKAIDNGNHLDPYDRGSLIFDPKFDLAEPNVQRWLLEFCRRLKQQRFIYSTKSPNLSNCFMETFKSWMDSRSCKDPIYPDHDRSPCCQAYEFPYSKFVLNRCIGEALNIIRKTPEYHPNINAGVRFFKNSSRVAAIIVEYQSSRFFSHSFTRMDRFFDDVNSWVTWQINNTAPPGLRSGWFISSHLDLLALQLELEQSTISSIGLEIGFAMLALILGTRNLVLTLAGTLAIGTIIIVTVALLIILKWTLGVVESVLISLTIGLSIDFALHYSIAYSEGRKNGVSSSIATRVILDEVGSPIALATTTTSLAGFIIAWSDIMAYQELGIFLIIIALTSWTTSTFFLLPMLTIMGSLIEFVQMQVRFYTRQVISTFVSRM